MKTFWKNPKLWIGVIVVAWLAYVVYFNFLTEEVPVYLFPLLTAKFKLSAIILVSAIAGCVLTLLVQFYWRKWRSSKNGSQSAATPGSSSKTVA